MSSKKGKLGLVVGVVVGVAAGAAAGLMLAPRSGKETREMLKDSAEDLLCNTADFCEQNLSGVSAHIDNLRPQLDATSDELRAKVDAARERMDQLCNALSDSVVSSAKQVQDAVDSVADSAVDGVEVFHVHNPFGDDSCDGCCND